MNPPISYLVVTIAMVGVFSFADDEGTTQSEPGQQHPKPGDIAFRTDFETMPQRQTWSDATWARWVDVTERGTCLRIDVPVDQTNIAHMVRLPLDLRGFQDCKLYFECFAKADGVTKPHQPYNGVKFMFHCVSPSQGPSWQNQNDVFGTFPWKRLAFSASVPDDVQEAWLLLGLQDSSGTVWFDDLQVTVLAVHPELPEPDPDAPRAFRGHDLPRLRGVMSPNTFRDEDLQVLGQEWHANLIRWQMTTRWGAEYRHPQDYDLELYNRWLETELTEMDQALEACHRYGMLLVIDLHSPPGGRRPNRDLVLLHEPAYLEAFVAIWERIARRYQGHPAVWGYDLVNEPVQNEPSPEGMPDYLGAQILAAKAIRAIDPERPILFEVDQWDSAEGFRYLTPVDVPRVIYQVHMYHPGEFTHQGVHSASVDVRYPGIIRDSMCDKESLREHLAPVRAFQLAYNVHIYVGEFSAIRWAPDNSAYRYLRDCIELFEEYGWDWSYHAFREWDGWSVEHGNERDDHRPTVAPTARKRLLLKWFAQNRKPSW